MVATTLPDNITPEEFQTALDQYDQIIEAVSASKGGEFYDTDFPMFAYTTLMHRQPNPVKRRCQSLTATGIPKHRLTSP